MLAFSLQFVSSVAWSTFAAWLIGGAYLVIACFVFLVLMGLFLSTEASTRAETKLELPKQRISVLEFVQTGVLAIYCSICWASLPIILWRWKPSADRAERDERNDPSDPRYKSEAP